MVHRIRSRKEERRALQLFPIVHARGLMAEIYISSDPVLLNAQTANSPRAVHTCAMLMCDTTLVISEACATMISIVTA